MYNNRNRKQFIDEAFSYYKSLGKIRCSALGNAPITFGNSGFTHLLRKQRITRPFQEVRRRISLLRHIPFVITDKSTLCAKTTSLNDIYGTISYFSLTNSIVGMKIKIILRQYGTGNIHFMSIMTI